MFEQYVFLKSLYYFILLIIFYNFILLYYFILLILFYKYFLNILYIRQEKQQAQVITTFKEGI